MKRRFYVTAAIIVTLAAVIGLQFHHYYRESAVPSESFTLDSQHFSEWNVIEGPWTVSQGLLQSQDSGHDELLVTGSKRWRNYSIDADLRIDSAASMGNGQPLGDAGLVLRTTDESPGMDRYQGYYIGLRLQDQRLLFGRASYGWYAGPDVEVKGGLHLSTWYHLHAVVYECNFAASVHGLRSGDTSWLAIKEESCGAIGRVGLRSHFSDVAWRNVSIKPSSYADYEQILRHTSEVVRDSHVYVYDAPWWTPWHAATLFVAASGLLLGCQFLYFQLRGWQAAKLSIERERLANKIHDTMAQGFAGVGYQLQGIRHNLLKDSSPSLHSVAEQLDTAYALVHRCHTEASTTISVLSSSKPITGQSLLAALESNACKLAGGQASVQATFTGTVAPLRFAVAEVMIEVGREAIANAICHSGVHNLNLHLTCAEASVSLVVEDDGKGFRVLDQTAGMGIAAMRKKSTMAGGELHLESAPGKGTRVTLTLPVRDAGSARRTLLSWGKRLSGAGRSTGPAKGQDCSSTPGPAK